MSESININLNDMSGGSDDLSRINPVGATAQDRNFDDLTGGPYRPDVFPAMPELLNIMSILSDSSTAIRKLFLPLRKLFQIMARSEQGDAPSSQLANRSGKFTRTPKKTEEESLIDKIKSQVAEMGYPVAPDSPKPTPPNVKTSVAPNLGANMPSLMKKIFGPNISNKVGLGLTKASNFLQANFTKVAGVAAGIATGLVAFGAVVSGIALAVKGYNSILNNFINKNGEISSQIQLAKARNQVRQLELSQKLNRESGAAAASVIDSGFSVNIELQKLGSSIIRTFEPLVSGIYKLVAPLIRLLTAIYDVLSPFIYIVTFVAGVLADGIGILISLISVVIETIAYPLKKLVEFMEWLRGLVTGKDGLDPALELFGMKREDFDKLAESFNPIKPVPMVKF